MPQKIGRTMKRSLRAFWDIVDIPNRLSKKWLEERGYVSTQDFYEDLHEARRRIRIEKREERAAEKRKQNAIARKEEIQRLKRQEEEEAQEKKRQEEIQRQQEQEKELLEKQIRDKKT